MRWDIFSPHKSALSGSSSFTGDDKQRRTPVALLSIPINKDEMRPQH
jgi:hypothetical protein